MSDWYIKFKNEIKEKLESFSVDFYFIAVSGGRDSVFLFFLLKDIFPKEKLVVLHMNHNLRGKQSDRDQEFVRKLAKQNGVICHTTTANLSLKPGGGGLENVARIARYEWFKEKINNNNALIFCGHTLDDHIETILMKMHRGAGLSGLKGISFQQEILGLNICRPLLFAERHHITKYLEDNKYTWCEDHTNASPEYFRNDIRLNLIPLLSASTKLRLVKLSVMSSQLQSQFKLLKGTTVSNGLEMEASAMKNLSVFELRYLIEKIFRYFGLPGGPEKKHMDRIQVFMKENKAHLQLSNFINIAYSREKFFFSKEGIESVPFLTELEVRESMSVDQKENNNESDKFILELPKDLNPLVKWRWVNLANDLWRDKPLVSFVKKLKIPPWRKSNIPLCEYNGEILFVGYLGVTKNYHNLISGHSELVTIEVLNKKVSL